MTVHARYPLLFVLALALLAQPGLLVHLRQDRH
jgi:hypothetical protein